MSLVSLFALCMHYLKNNQLFDIYAQATRYQFSSGHGPISYMRVLCPLSLSQFMPLVHSNSIPPNSNLF